MEIFITLSLGIIIIITATALVSINWTKRSYIYFDHNKKKIVTNNTILV